MCGSECHGPMKGRRCPPEQTAAAEWRFELLATWAEQVALTRLVVVEWLLVPWPLVVEWPLVLVALLTSWPIAAEWPMPRQHLEGLWATACPIS